VPLQEDYGFVTAEACASGKAVITTTDSGGPAELVIDGSTGRVVAPTPAALAEAIAGVMHDQARAERLGQAARATAPFIVIWDDHETANDAFGGGAENHDPLTEGSWTNRVAAALQAYYEWQPIREPQGGDLRKAYRSFDFGNLLSLHMLETRLTSRDRQLELAPTPDEVLGRINSILGTSALLAQYAATHGLTPPSGPGDAAGIARFGNALAPIVLNEMVARNVTAMYTGERKLLGTEQMQWLQGRLASSSATWQVLGQQVLMGNMTMPAELLISLE
jgi:hypothetical protein